MRRLFWLATGLSLGAWLARKLSRAIERLTPGSMVHRLSGSVGELAESVGSFGGDVRAAMRAREAELRAGAGLDGAGDGDKARTGGARR
ncbi:MAG: chromosome partition protein MukE [Actinomycetia bacterium]|nr:chromosome partition protein MukE [Actinomycetes bacterium]